MKKPNIHDFKHIAIMQTAFLGDVALTLYLIQAIRNIHPRVEITLVTTNQARSIGEAATAINNVLVFDKRHKHKGIEGILQLSKEMNNMGIDCIISPHKSLRSSLTCFLAKAKFTVAFKNSDFAFLYKKRMEYNFHLHEVHRHLNLLNAFEGFSEAEFHNLDVDIAIPIKDKHQVETLMFENKLTSFSKLVIIAPKSAWKTKEWGESNFELLASKLLKQGYSPILIGSNTESSVCSQMAQKVGISSFAGKLTILQSIYLISIAKLLITNDSSPTHFASLVSTKKIVIYGPTSPIFGFYPRGKNDIIIENSKLKCRPCQIHGSNECPISTHECMTSISVDRVFSCSIDLLTR